MTAIASNIEAAAGDTIDGTSTGRAWIVSVDDHVVEPPRLWTDRAPVGLADRVPHVKRERVPSRELPGEEVWADVWYYEDTRVVVQRGFASAGLDPSQVDDEPVVFDDLRPGCFDVPARLADMDIDAVEASLCFPNVVVRFCGQLFLEATDKDVALDCLRAYNDWLIEEFAGQSDGRPARGRGPACCPGQNPAARSHRCRFRPRRRAVRRSRGRAWRKPPHREAHSPRW